MSDVLKLHTHDDHVLITAMRFSSFIVPYAEAPVAEAIITDGGFDAALLSTLENKKIDENVVAQLMWVCADVTAPVAPRLALHGASRLCAVAPRCGAYARGRTCGVQSSRVTDLGARRPM